MRLVALVACSERQAEASLKQGADFDLSAKQKAACGWRSSCAGWNSKRATKPPQLINMGMIQEWPAVDFFTLAGEARCKSGG